MVHGHRGGVIGAVVTTAIVVGSTTPQFLGAMAIGPLAAWIQKKLDGVLQPATPEGFEMLVDNFSLGILGTILAVVSKNVIGPILQGITDALGNAAGALVDAGLVPLADIPIRSRGRSRATRRPSTPCASSSARSPSKECQLG